MHDHSVSLSERGVRYHLKLMDNRGLTKLIGRHDGRAITELGIEEIRTHGSMTRSASPSPASRSSLSELRWIWIKDRDAPVNVSFFPRKVFKKALELMKPAFVKDSM